MRRRCGKRSSDAAFEVCKRVAEQRILRVLESLAARGYVEERGVGIFNDERCFSAYDAGNEQRNQGCGESCERRRATKSLSLAGPDSELHGNPPSPRN
jgi:hypothetical protein